MRDIFNTVKQSFSDDFTASTLKTLIVLWSVVIILLALFVVNNKLLLAAILAYEVLP